MKSIRVLFICLIVLIGTINISSTIAAQVTKLEREANTFYFPKFSCSWAMVNIFALPGVLSADFSVPESCFVSVCILDSTENMIYEFYRGNLADGDYSIEWKKIDSLGNSVPDGTYYLNIDAKSVNLKKPDEFMCHQSFYIYDPSVKVYPKENDSL